MTSTQVTVLVTGAGGPLGVNLTRSLLRAAPPPRVIGTEANRWHLPLSLTETTYLIPLARDRAAYRAALAQVCASEKVDVIVPTHPVEVRTVAELRDAGELGRIGTALPARAVIEVADDKARTQAGLLAAGVPVPRTMLLTDQRDLERAFADYRASDEPVWIRGSGAPGLGIGGAALPCRDRGVARAWIEHHGGWGKMAASEYLPGDNLSWMAVFDRGTLLAAGARQRLEYVLPHVSPSGITGAPAVSRTIRRDDVADIGERAVRALDPQPHGVYFVDLKCDQQDRPLVTEINAGRCGTTIEAYSDAGCNFPLLLVELARGRHPAPLAEPNRAVAADVYWIRTLDCGPVSVQGAAGFDDYPRVGRDD